jgi:hypothetical protein
MSTPELSEEAKAMVRAYVQKKREELGPNWKEIEAERVAAETMKLLEPLLGLLGAKRSD